MYGIVKGEWIRGVAWASRPKPWVARLMSLDSHWGFQRQFVKGVYDYSYVHTRNAGRGIYLYFALAPGLYEVFTPISWKHERRYFIRVDESGKVLEIERD